MDLKDKIRDLSNQINALERERKVLQREEIAQFQREHRSNIGRCFRLNNEQYAIIVDVPQVEETLSGASFNRHQFPCFILNAGKCDRKVDDDFYVVFCDGTLYSRDGMKFGGDAPLSSEPDCEEISFNEFCARFNECVELLKNRVFGSIIQEDKQ